MTDNNNLFSQTNQTPQTSSLFDEVSKKIQESKVKNSEEVIEDKMKERNQNLFNTKVKTKIEDIRTEIGSHEISLRKNNREEEFDKKRRLTKMINSNISTSLLHKIQLNKDFYEKCVSIEVQGAEQLSQFLSKFRDTSSIETIFYGLIGIRKLSSLGKFIIKFQ